jgi:hypothetical protein
MPGSGYANRMPRLGSDETILTGAQPYVRPLRSRSKVVPTLVYAAVLMAAMFTVYAYRLEVAAWHRLRPRATAFLVAIVMAAILAVGRADAFLVYSCTDQHRDQVCGAGESWCRTLGEWNCWLWTVLY